VKIDPEEFLALAAVMRQGIVRINNPSDDSTSSADTDESDCP
jgi:hypothetical protein